MAAAANTLAYYDISTIMAVKSFTLQAAGLLPSAGCIFVTA